MQSAENVKLTIELESIAQFMRLGKKKEALKSLNELMKKYPRSAIAHFQQGCLCTSMGKFDEARCSFNKIINFSEDYDESPTYSADAHFYLAMIHLFQENQKAALEELKQCLHLNSNHDLAKKHYSILMDYEGSLDRESKEWGDFDLEIYNNGTITTWIDLQKGERLTSEPAFWADPEVEKLLRGEAKQEIFETFSDPLITKILDIGCGTGWLSLELARMGKEVDGIELSGKRLEIAKEIASKENLSINYILGDVNHYSFQEDYYDAIVIWDSLHHIPNVYGFMKKIKKAAKTSGKILIYENIGLSEENCQFANFFLESPPIKLLPQKNLNQAREAQQVPLESPFENVGIFLMEDLIELVLNVYKKSSHLAITGYLATQVDFNCGNMGLLSKIKEVEESLIEQSILKGKYVFIRATNDAP